MSEGQGLAVKRKIGQGVIIDGRIHVSIAEIDGKQIKIRIKAPQDVLILRDECATDGRKDFYASRTPRSPIEGAVSDLFSQRNERLEAMSAKFVQEVGPVDAQDYELVEQRSEDGLETRWFFRPKGSGGGRR